jgi:hypothetical protein
MKQGRKESETDKEKKKKRKNTGKEGKRDG